MKSDKPDILTTLANSIATAPTDYRGTPITSDLYRAGADYVSRGKVKSQSVVFPGTNRSELTGAVQCGFGITHHPALTIQRRSSGVLVERFQCGCREGLQGRFCAHCAALLVTHCGHQDAWITDGDLLDEAENAGPIGTLVRLGTGKQTGEPVLWTPEDPQRLATANLALIGQEHTGNTQMLESMVLQLLRQKAQAGEPMGILICDGMNDYSESRATFVEAVGARVMRLHKLPLNPFSLRGLERKPQLHTHIAMSFADALARAYGLGALQKSTLVQSILAAYAARGITSDPVTWDLMPPTFKDVYEEYCSRPQAQRDDALAPVMENPSLLDLFDENVKEYSNAYDLLQGVVILDMSGYPETLKHFALGVLLEMFHTQMCSRERTLSRQLHKAILVDKADLLLAAGSPGLEGILSQGREFGVALLLSAQSLDGFLNGSFDYRKWIRTWVLHNVADLRKTDLEFLLQMDIHDSSLERMYQVSRHLQKLHSLVRFGTEDPVLTEDLPFYEILSDTAQSYLKWESPELEPEPLAGMPLLDTADLDSLVALDDSPATPMVPLDDLTT